MRPVTKQVIIRLIWCCVHAGLWFGAGLGMIVTGNPLGVILVAGSVYFSYQARQAYIMLGYKIEREINNEWGDDKV